MARGLAEDRSRRLGRVEMLLTELEQLPDGYQPTGQEAKRFAALAALIIEKYCLGEVIVGDFPLASAQEKLAAAKAEIERLSVLLAERNTELAQAKTDLAQAQEQDRAMAEAQIEKRKTADGKPKTEK